MAQAHTFHIVRCPDSVTIEFRQPYIAIISGDGSIQERRGEKESWLLEDLRYVARKIALTRILHECANLAGIRDICAVAGRDRFDRAGTGSFDAVFGL